MERTRQDNVQEKAQRKYEDQVALTPPFKLAGQRSMRSMRVEFKAALSKKDEKE